MDSKKTKSLVDGAIADLEAKLKAGKSDALKRVLEVAARFHHYSFRNQLLIAMQRPDATRVAGFQAWKKLGRFVQKGEKGIAIIAPLIGRKREEVDAQDSESAIFGFRAVYVFDVASTEGAPLPEIESTAGDPAEHTESLKRFADARAITIEHQADLGGPQGISYGGRIVILEGLSSAEEFSVLAHELAHELMHRDKETRPASKTVRETEAEAVAFILCTAAGLETGCAHSDYIQLYRGDTETLTSSLERIQHASAEIITALGKEGESAAA